MKISTKILGIICFACVAIKVSAGNQGDEVNPYGKLLEGNGVRVEMATYTQKNADGLQDVLMKITGGPAYDAGIDGKVFRYQAMPAGTGFNLVKDGLVRMSVRSPWSWNEDWTTVELFLDNKKYSLYYNTKGASEVIPAHLLSEYKKN